MTKTEEKIAEKAKQGMSLIKAEPIQPKDLRKKLRVASDQNWKDIVSLMKASGMRVSGRGAGVKYSAR